MDVKDGGLSVGTGIAEEADRGVSWDRADVHLAVGGAEEAWSIGSSEQVGVAARGAALTDHRVGEGQVGSCGVVDIYMVLHSQMY